MMIRRIAIGFFSIVLFYGCKNDRPLPIDKGNETINPVHISSKDGKIWNVFGVKITAKILSDDTHGAYAVIVTETPPEAGPPLHVHTHEDELFYVLKGRYEFSYGDKRVEVNQGDFIHLPKGIPHKFVNKDSTTGITMNTISPGGFENFFEDIANLSEKNMPSRAIVDSIASTYGIKFIKN